MGEGGLCEYLSGKIPSSEYFETKAKPDLSNFRPKMRPRERFEAAKLPTDCKQYLEKKLRKNLKFLFTSNENDENSRNHFFKF